MSLKENSVKNRAENRVEILRDFIDELIKNKVRGEFYFIERHMFAVSNFAAMLAMKRGLDLEIALIIGLLHDVQTLMTDDPENHAELGSLRARGILYDLKIVSDTELEIICTAIKNHSSKDIVHDKYSELAKDADVLNHYFVNPTLSLYTERGNERLERLIAELGLDAPYIESADTNIEEDKL